MNNVPDENGNKASRVKLIRAESIGNYSLDNKGEQWTGDNNWNTSPMQYVLNSGAYWNRTNGTCPAGANEATVECDFSNTGLTYEAKYMLTEVVWNLGENRYYGGTASTFYTQERGKRILFLDYPATWRGYVGLMYMSDFGFSVENNKRNTCLNTNLEGYFNSGCNLNNWLIDNKTYFWTLSLSPNSLYNQYFISRSEINTGNTHNIFFVRPVVYLNTNIKFTGTHTGSSSDPYILSN